MQTASKISIFAFGLAAFLIIGSNPVSAQTKSTLDGFNKPKVKKQKAPQRQLALRIENQETKKQDNSQTSKTLKPKTNPEKQTPPNVSDQRRKELFEFVETHHKELKPLLNQLRKKRPSQYQSVLRSLDVKVRQLQSIEKKSPARHKQMLDDWTLQSKIQLLSAQIAIKNSEKEKGKLRAQIRPLIQKQIDTRIKQFEADAKNAKERYDKISKQLKTLTEKRDSGEVDRRMSQIDKTSQRISAQRANNKKKKTENVKKKQSPATDAKESKTEKQKKF